MFPEACMEQFWILDQQIQKWQALLQSKTLPRLAALNPLDVSAHLCSAAGAAGVTWLHSGLRLVLAVSGTGSVKNDLI